MSFEDAICCDKADQATKEYFKKLSHHPEALSEILKIVLERLPSASSAPLTSKQRNHDETCTSIQTLVVLISAKFALLMSLNGGKRMLQMSFQRITFELVQLLEDGASTVFTSSSKKKLTIYFSSLPIISAFQI